MRSVRSLGPEVFVLRDVEELSTSSTCCQSGVARDDAAEWTYLGVLSGSNTVPRFLVSILANDHVRRVTKVVHAETESADDT